MFFIDSKPKHWFHPMGRGGGVQKGENGGSFHMGYKMELMGHLFGKAHRLISFWQGGKRCGGPGIAPSSKKIVGKFFVIKVIGGLGRPKFPVFFSLPSYRVGHVCLVGLVVPQIMIVALKE